MKFRIVMVFITAIAMTLTGIQGFNDRVENAGHIDEVYSEINL